MDKCNKYSSAQARPVLLVNPISIICFSCCSILSHSSCERSCLELYQHIANVSWWCQAGGDDNIQQNLTVQLKCTELLAYV